MKLHALSAALAMGLLWGLTLLVLTILSVQNGYGTDVLMLVADLYPGYEVTNEGALIGLVWAFLDAFVGTYILVWLYNKLVDKLGKKKK